jgi:ribosomal protein S27AE
MRRKRPTERDPWRQETSDALMMLTGMKEWRQQHPHATLREIEQAMDERLNKLRAGMLEELAHLSPQTDWNQAAPEDRPRCERCGTTLVSRGKQRRWLQTSGGEFVDLERSYGTCPECGQGLFPPG